VTVSTTRYHLGIFTSVNGGGTYYHDGVASGTQASSTPYYDTNGGTQYLGRGDNQWKGNVFRRALYNRVLTQSEITRTLRNSGPTFFNTCKTCKDIIDTFLRDMMDCIGFILVDRPHHHIKFIVI
jgi:hypothetical protein